MCKVIDISLSFDCWLRVTCSNKVNMLQLYEYEHICIKGTV